MVYIIMALFAALIVAADQFTKYLTVANIAAPLGTEAARITQLQSAFFLQGKDLSQLPVDKPFIPGFLSFDHAHNEGAAFSALQGQRWLFILLFVVLTVAVIWEFWKKPLGFNKFERWCIVAIWAGGLGNMIDRVRLGFVVDMIRTDFMVFPIFNVADCFVTCGCIALMISLVFFNRSIWKDEKKK